MLNQLEMGCSESSNYCFGCGIASRMQKQSKSGSTSPASHTWQMISQVRHCWLCVRGLLQVHVCSTVLSKIYKRVQQYCHK